jgi:hypothetical protein
MLFDLFICHASEDKDDFVRPLAQALQDEHVEVWFDEFTLTLGDSIRRAIDKGLSQSRFGAVVLSPAFFSKNWPQYELDGLVERELSAGAKVTLPIWHNVTYKDVSSVSPSLADKKAVLSASGLSQVVSEILRVVRPQGSPLIIARDLLIEKGWSPPVVTDPYWLEVVEASNRVPATGAVIPQDSGWGRWSFPLPERENDSSSWGDRLAWAAMQLEWTREADRRPITVMTPPEMALGFIETQPGLRETCETFPSLVAEYAPQLTIPGFGGFLEETFDKEYKKSCRKSAQRDRTLPKILFEEKGDKRYFGDTYPSLCEEEWKLRHPTFAGFGPYSIANHYFHADGMFGPDVALFDDPEHLFWLLSDASLWLPQKIRDVLQMGMCALGNRWMWYEGRDELGEWATKGTLARAIQDAEHDRKAFVLTDEAFDDLKHRARNAKRLLRLPESQDELVRRFIDGNVVTRFLESVKEVRQPIKKKSP